MVIAIKELAVYHRDGHRVPGILTKLILVDKDITLNNLPLIFKHLEKFRKICHLSGTTVCRA